MMKNRNKLIVLILLVFVFTVGANDCQQTKMSNVDLYYSALGYWQNTFDNFKLVYDNSDLTKEQKKEMLPAMQLLLTTKKSVLNTWKVAIANEDTGEIINKNAEWKKAKNRLLLEVINKYLKEE